MEFKCSICLDTLFSVNTDVCVTQCGHLFHKVCIEGAMQNNLQCPNCNTGISEDMVNKIHPDVFDELACNDCSIETKNLLEEIYNNDKEKRKTMLKIVKKLDKENASLKETNNTNQENYNTCKTFLKTFQNVNKDLQEKIQKLKFRNTMLLAEIGKLNDGVVNNESEISNVEIEKQIEKNVCGDIGVECCTDIENLDKKGLFVFIIIIL